MLLAPTFSPNLTDIGAGAFSDCISFYDVELPSGLKSIGDYAFANCTELISVTFNPCDIEILSEHIFENCYALEEIILPQTIKTIEANAFYNCISLKEITIPLSVTEIKSQAFQGCYQLTSVNFEQPSGWVYSFGTSWIEISETQLNNPETAAEYLQTKWKYILRNMND